MGLGAFREAIVDRVEVCPHRADVGGDLLRRLVLDRDAGEQVRDLGHLRFPHPEPRELLRPEADAARLHRGRVPRKEVLVRDDVRLLQVPGDLRAAAEGRDIEGDRVALGETVLLREGLDAAFVECLGEGLRVPDDLRGVVPAELQEFRERDPRAAIAWRWWFDTTPGKTARCSRLMNFSSSESDSRMPCCGPGSVLWVEPVRTSAPSCSGSWNCPPAIRPITCAPSYQTRHPASWNASPNSRSGV